MPRLASTVVTCCGLMVSANWLRSPRRLTTRRGLGGLRSHSSRSGGGQVVAAERYGSDATDFRTQLTKLFNEEPDALHVASQSEFAGGTILKQARELGTRVPYTRT